jgi:NodT family efflux transporter outer membrane factor (OMF) lipoprotein
MKTTPSRPVAGAFSHSSSWGHPGPTNPLLLILLTILLSACTLSPNYTPPDPTTQLTWNEGRSSIHKAQTSLTKDFGDRQLATLLTQAEAHNRTLATARANLRTATAQRDAARSALLPKLSASTDLTRARQSGTGAFAGLPIPNPQTLYASGLDVSWELDLFGYNRSRLDADQARLEATNELLAATRLAILAETALAYIEWAALSESLALAQDRLDSQKETHALVQARLSSGLADTLKERSVSRDVRLAEAEIPPLRAGLAAAQYRLAVLTGSTPADFASTHRAPAALPKSTARTLPATFPAQVLRARPDVHAAERQLAASYAELGMANADFYPRLRISGGLGLQSDSTGTLFESASRTGLIRPAIHLPVFEGGRLRAGLASAQARRDAAQSTYESTILEALAEVETILAAHQAAVQTDTALTAALADAQAAESRAAALYQTGLSDLETLLTARRLRSATDTLRIAARVSTLTQSIRYQKAAGL